MSEIASPAVPTADQLLKQLGAHLGADGVSALKGLLSQTIANIKANPTGPTVAAQSALLIVAAPAVVPTLETEAIGQAADTLGQIIDLIQVPAVPQTGSDPVPAVG